MHIFLYGTKVFVWNELQNYQLG